MAIPGALTSVYVQQANRQVYLSWDLSVGATSYSVQRSTDQINYTTVATPVVTNYLDTSVSVGVAYYYQVAAVNASGTSNYSTPQSVVPTPTGEMSLGQIRLNAQQRGDRVNSNFLTLPEWNTNIRQAMYELYDILITSYEDYAIATPAQFTTVGNQYLYPLPDGATTFANGVTGVPFVAAPFYKLTGVDLALNSASNAWVTINKFNFQARNTYVYPNTASTIYGIFNIQYRMLGNNMEFIPTPSANQNIRIWYIPRLQELLKDTDISDISISGWIEYVIVRAAKYALDKEESDSSKLDVELGALTKRIEESASNRDANEPDTVVDIRKNGQGNWGNNFGGPIGGF